MRWSRGHTGGIDDRRAQGDTAGGFGMGGLGGGGGGIPIPVGVGGTGGLIIVVIIVVLNLLSGSGGGGGSSLGTALDPYGGGGGTGPEPGASVDLSNNGDMVEFVGFVLDDANSLWADTFKRAGKPYTPARMVLFDGGTQSGCGPASADTGPFYCPVDQKVYIDLAFFRELKDRFGAPGDFAQAYVVAHEIGHHVQQQSGIEQQVRDMMQQDPSQQNALSVKMELQADCLAGVWGQSVYEQGDLDSGDVDEGLKAASAVGDDRIQAAAGADVNPETWTHGSAEQRSTWFRKGVQTGDPAACDTFGS